MFSILKVVIITQFIYLLQRFRTKTSRSNHSKSCRALLNPIANDGGEPTPGCSSSNAASSVTQCNVLLKECSVVMKKEDFIERAIKMGYTSLSSVSQLDANGNKTIEWVNSS